MEGQRYLAVISKEDDLYIAECPEVGTVSRGRTQEEALAHLKAATALYLERFSFVDSSEAEDDES